MTGIAASLLIVCSLGSIFVGVLSDDVKLVEDADALHRAAHDQTRSRAARREAFERMRTEDGPFDPRQRDGGGGGIPEEMEQQMQERRREMDERRAQRRAKQPDLPDLGDAPGGFDSTAIEARREERRQEREARASDMEKRKEQNRQEWGERRAAKEEERGNSRERRAENRLEDGPGGDAPDSESSRERMEERMEDRRRLRDEQRAERDKTRDRKVRPCERGQRPTCPEGYSVARDRETRQMICRSKKGRDEPSVAIECEDSPGFKDRDARSHPKIGGCERDQRPKCPEGYRLGVDRREREKMLDADPEEERDRDVGRKMPDLACLSRDDPDAEPAKVICEPRRMEL